MTATHTHRSNTAITRLIQFAFALMLVFTSLATTGCDTLDSNAVMDESSIDERRILMSTETLHQVANTEAPCVKDKQGGSFACLNENGASKYVGPPDVAPIWYDLVGTWQYVEAGVLPNKTITFTLNQRVRVETVCTTHEGPFSSESQGQLTIAYLQLIDQTCGPLAEEPLIRMLEAAIAYKVQDGQLSIGSGWHQQTLLFNAAAATDFPKSGEPHRLSAQHLQDADSDDDAPLFIGPPEIEDDDKPQIIGPPEEDDDEPLFIGPPEVDGGEGQKEKKDQ